MLNHDINCIKSIRFHYEPHIPSTLMKNRNLFNKRGVMCKIFFKTIWLIYQPISTKGNEIYVLEKRGQNYFYIPIVLLFTWRLQENQLKNQVKHNNNSPRRYVQKLIAFPYMNELENIRKENIMF